MKKLILLILIFSSYSSYTMNAEEDSVMNIEDFERYMHYLDSVEQAFNYQYGEVVIGNNLATIDVPEGFKFLDADQSAYVLTELWGNPPSDVLGMLFPEEISPVSESFTYAIEITYSEDGFIDDEGAREIDYQELLEQMKDGVNEANEEREKLGYTSYELVGWASEPHYNSEEKKLYWAQELNFEGAEINTLNYNIRILGRKGYLRLNAIGDIDILPLVEHDASRVLSNVSFNDGYKYSDFNPSVDKVAAYGIGGLIAGKVLAKTGFLAVLLKFGKFIVVGIIGLFAAMRKRLFGSSQA